MTNDKFFKSGVAFPLTEEAMAFADTGGLPIKNITIGVTNPDASYHISRKNYGMFTFEYVLEGKGEILYNGKKIPITKGDTYILLAGEDFSYRSIPSAPMKKYWINFECDYMAKMLKSYGIELGVYKTDTLALFENLVYSSKSDKPFSELYVTIAECLHSIVVRASLSKKANLTGDAQIIKEKLLSAVYRKINLKEIANDMGMCESNLIRVFKKRFTVTPYEFLINAKIDASKLLLSNTEMSVKEIAERVQILDEHYFSTVFLSKTGMRPTAYRNMQKQR